MSNGDELYIRKPRSTDPIIASDIEDQMWDDSSMTAAYDKAVNKANAEIAKQIAMETNSKFKGNGKSNEKKGKSLPTKTPKGKWEKGMACRVVYASDGLEYEAMITAILDKTECVVKYLGFENSEVVSIGSLKDSQGEEARFRQIEQATREKLDDGFESQSNDDASVLHCAPSQHKGKKSKKKSHTPRAPDYPKVPDLLRLSSAFSGPPLPDFRLPNIPFPPPPPPAALHSADPEDQALSSMLISWYMSGYHTGLYQGLKRGKESRRH